ncbi:tRNA preQ1(34) S-adenosylmethionine ribosyltransferase-isomerase QueA [Treponema ruminis]|uniref:S-adenosylmethionine:tRNA ribosyltransferase-isomerase n=1 Tax=Treponema ruminis TaxID=744515 RepID=A0A7W8G896_9SPIR|nr:tRNA preQ1(34) S-adenosylmethionine ribosyltransferase-isomerase QueA [Treponema ruminis]MBB5225539.1 S-adenosylmethionine:tRNA ribosyltransferase-isomerase [Treponema ruminis]QSI01592.1 tRNA preQ1(34) S-adenosylmethionine ribosyltransferase-isomerase QueA [Treponema ruminis]
MKLSDFYFDLPEELIAQKPSGIRGQDRLMLLNRETGEVRHLKMDDLPDLITPDTLMVFNNSKVRRSRCYGIKLSDVEGQGGREQEFMFLNQMTPEGNLWHTMVKGAKKVKAGNKYRFTDGSVGTIIEHENDSGSEFRTIQFDSRLDDDWFGRNGHIPLPPYIRREDDDTDSERYQTVYAKETGSSACPTAGLHFTEDMFRRLDEKGIERVFVTLHVGLGTFLPVRTENIEEHKMHEEVYTIPFDVAEKINQAKKDGRPILAVGTTSVRTLESASDENGFVKGGSSATHIFMYPGYKFKCVNQMFTNFHTPESTLIMLVSAFAGREHILNAYQKAVEEKYHFFSYGDCMLIR